MDQKPRVLVVGAGFGGLAAARGLADAAVDVTVVDQRNHHTFQPLLYQVATAGLDADDICYATRGIFHRQENARALQARVTDVDLDRQLVRTDDGPPLPYDRLILALGAITADFGVPGVAEHAFGLKSAAEATAIRSHVLRLFERAERAMQSDPQREPNRHSDRTSSDAATTIVIVGGGPTGVEMAGGFLELFNRPLRRDFPGIGIDRTRVVLVEGQDRLLATFAPRLADRALRELERMGVEVRLSTQVAEVTADWVRLSDGDEIATNTVVWAAGVRAHPLADAIGLETDSVGRVIVDDRLRVPGRPEVSVIGDLASARRSNDPDAVVPQVAPGAIQAGRYVAATIANWADSGEIESTVKPFRYRDKGSMATIGRNAAVVEVPGGLKVTGFAGWVAWLGLHLIMLIGFRNRANVLVNWAWNYATYDRASRLIIEPDQRPELQARSSTERP